MASFSNSQTTPWTLTTKSTFQTELLAVAYAPILEEKINQLAYDPYPDGRNRRALTGTTDEIYMLRLGEYAAFYTIQKPFVSLLALRSRQAFASADGFPAPDEIDQLLGKAQTSFPWGQVQPSLAMSTKPQPQPLPRRLTKDFLSSLRIPAQYHLILQRVQTRPTLLNCPGVPPECIQRLDTSLFEPPLAQVQQEATYVLSKASDLQRYKDGSLHTFLLLLAPEQEKAVTSAAAASGPVQVKGKPGTGKSTVALYRIRSFIQKQQESGQGRPRVLFTTFNNTLAETSKQLLELLLENQIHCVQISTADKLITNLFKGNLQKAEEPTQVELLRRALRQIMPEEARKQEFLNKYSEEYLLEEMNKLIIARKISTETGYLSFERTGRKVALREGDRRIIWRLYELYCELLCQHRQETWSQWRVRAEEYLLKQTDTPTYDAVFIDEAQDLEPSAIRILFRLCKTPNRFFITADANQSIYNKGFSWVGVHEELKFQGRRTITLKTNYRSTRQIGEAAESYLRTGAVEIDTDEWIHANIGARPAMRTTSNDTEEVQTLIAFLNTAMQSLHVGLQSCAIFCPTNEKCRLLVQALKEQGIEAVFQTKGQSNFTVAGVRVLTLHSSKGLEFPVVALAGFHQTPYAQAWEHLSDDERGEKLVQARKVMFVGMTRAMKMLLVLVPDGTRSALLTGFDPAYWNIE